MKKNSTLKLALLATSALAAEAVLSAAAAAEVERLIVTATRRAENEQKVPVSITAFSNDMIEEAGYIDTQEILAATPNVNFTRDRGLATGANITIRGMGTAVPRTDQPIAVYVDDIYLSNESMFNAGLDDLQRVEVLRGPQSTLYGRNAMGGVVHFITNKPSDEFEASVQATYGNYDYMAVSGMVNLPLIEGKLAIRGNIFANQRDSVVEPTQDPRELDDKDNIGGRLQLRADLSERVTFDLAGDYSKDDISAFAVVPLSLAREYKSNYLRAFDNPREIYGGSAKFKIDLGSAELLSITGLRYLETTFDDGACFTPGDECLQFFAQDTDQFTQELRVTSNTDGPLSWIAGGYYLKEDREQESGLFFRDFAPFFSFAFGDPTGMLIPFGTREASAAALGTKSASVFGELTYRFESGFSATIGGRYLWEEKTLDYAHTNSTMPFGPGFGVFAPIQTIVIDDTFDGFLPKFSLSYEVNDDVLTYVTVSRGYKGGGYNAEFLGAPADRTPMTPLTDDDLRENYQFDPETLWNYEAGFKTQFWDGKAVLNGAVFFVDWRDQQVLTGDSVASKTENIDKSRSYGFELATSVRPSSAVDFGLGIGWVDATFREGTADFAGLGVIDVSGDRQPNVSKFTLNTHLQYTLEVSDDISAPVRAEFSYHSGFFHTIATDNVLSGLDLSQAAQDGYGILNLRAGIETERFGVYVFAKNVLDQFYTTSALVETAAGFLNSGFVPGYPPLVADDFHVGVGDPRTYGITVRVRFL